MTERTNLQKAIDLLEDNGFHVNSAYEETFQDIGDMTSDTFRRPENRTGAIVLRITPETD